MAEVMSPEKAVSILRSAIVNARIYPKGSQMIEWSLQGALQAFESCLEGASPLVISDIHGKLCVNGKEAASARDFRPFLVQHEVQSLKFMKGLKQNEISLLIEGLGKRKGQLDDHKTLAEWLKSQQVNHIEAEEVHFIAIQKGDVVVQQIIQLLEQSAGDTPSLLNALEESYKMMDQLPDDKSRKEVQHQLAKHLTGLPPYQLRELLDAKFPEKAEAGGLRQEIVQTLSREKLEETLEEVNKWYKQIKEESQSELEVVEKLNGLKSFLGKILHSPASKQVSFALYEEMLNVGLLEQVPEGVTKGENSSLLTEVEHLLSLPSSALLDPPVRQRFPDLLKALCGMGFDDPLQRLTDKIIENLPNPAPVVRETAVKTLRVFEETLAANRKERILLTVVTTLHKMCETETAPDVYGEIAQALRVAAMELLVNWRFEESAAILAMLRRHSRDESPIGQKKKQLAAKALKDFSGRGLDVLCADLNAPLKDRQNGAYRVLAELGEEAVEPLVEAVKRSIDPRARQAAIHAIQRLGPSVKETVMKQINIGLSGDVLVKLIPLLEDYVDASVLPTFTGLLQHPDAPVRRAVAQLLTKVQDPRAQTLLLGLLDDAESDIQAEAVRYIGELRITSVIPDLNKRLLQASPEVQEEICITLGNFSASAAVPYLIRLIQDKGFLWKKSAVTDSVRLRAIWALGQMRSNPDAQKALQRAQKDSNVIIQRAAQSALSKTAVPAQ